MSLMKLATRKYTKKIFQVVLILLFFGLFITSYSVNAKNDVAFAEVYHVYVDGEYIGTVDDKDVVDDVVTNKEAEFKAEDPDITGMVSNDIELVSEYVFEKPATDSDSNIEQQLNEMITVKASVPAITINGEPKYLFNTRDEAEQTLEIVANQYTGGEALPPDGQSTEELVSSLQVGESKITNVSFDQDVQVETVFLEPTKIFTVDEAVQSLSGVDSPTELYTVKEGEDFSEIALKFGLSDEDLLAVNPGLVKEQLTAGQQISIYTKSNPVQVNVERVTKKQEMVPFSQTNVEDPMMIKGQIADVQFGVDGSKEVVEKSTIINGQTVTTEPILETMIVSPIDQITKTGTLVLPDVGTGQFLWPTNGGYVSSVQGQRWGAAHKGIDIARPSNYNIKASDTGVVKYAGWSDSGYGNMVEIDHQNGFSTLYGHLDSVNVQVGQVVQKGVVIGLMGNTGDSTGTHLHFELHKNGEVVNPLDYVPR